MINNKIIVITFYPTRYDKDDFKEIVSYFKQYDYNIKVEYNPINDISGELDSDFNMVIINYFIDSKLIKYWTCKNLDILKARISIYLNSLLVEPTIIKIPELTYVDEGGPSGLLSIILTVSLICLIVILMQIFLGDTV